MFTNTVKAIRSARNAAKAANNRAAQPLSVALLKAAAGNHDATYAALSKTLDSIGIGSATTNDIRLRTHHAFTALYLETK